MLLLFIGAATRTTICSSQGGIAYILEQEYGIALPKDRSEHRGSQH